ncbi:MAG: ATP-binding protein [Pirellulales bacterium]
MFERLIHDVLPLVEHELRRHAVHVALFLDDLPTIYADGIQIQQVLLNLVKNAIEAMSQVDGEHHLEIHARNADGAVRVNVVDTGPGLATEMCGRLFHPFQTTKAEGLGLGLPICRSLIEAHGGEIDAVANAGQGMTFYFIIPCAPTDQDA